MKIFSVPIEGLSIPQIIQHLEEGTSRLTWIVTANPEILLEARRDPAYASILRQADFRLVDGFGLWLMLRLFGVRTTRVTGVDLAERLVAFAVRRDWKIALVGGGPGVAHRACEKFRQPFPHGSFLAEQGGHVTSNGTDDAVGEEARHRLTLFAPDVLLVAFGHPKQEQWIARHRQDFPSLKVVMGVGGTFDYWAGTVLRAPKILRRLGLEWAWRLMQEPHRLRRILRAVFVFPFFVYTDPHG